MKNLKIGNSIDAIKQTRSLLPWRVIHVPYPRETVEYSCFGLRWIPCWKIKLPKIFLQKRTLEKQGPSVNYDLLCQQLELVLNHEEAAGYELIAIHPTHSGSYAATTTQQRPHHRFLKTHTPTHHLQAKETLLLVFKKMRGS